MKTINTTIKILSIASNQTDSIKIYGLLTQVKSLNFQLNKIQDIFNIFDSIQDSGQVILWALNRYESTNAVVLLKIQNINNSCNIPLIIILAEADFRHKYSIAGVNYCLVFLEQVAIQLGIAIRQWLLYQRLEQANKKLAQQAATDNLTRVANRRQFEQYIALEWKRSAREKHPLSLILCDIDYFKLYNDAYGHLLGDRCLKIVALAIAKVTKRPADLVARYGGGRVCCNSTKY